MSTITPRSGQAAFTAAIARGIRPSGFIASLPRSSLRSGGITGNSATAAMPSRDSSLHSCASSGRSRRRCPGMEATAPLSAPSATNSGWISCCGASSVSRTRLRMKGAERVRRVRVLGKEQVGMADS
jgi:hypothetical protein